MTPEAFQELMDQYVTGTLSAQHRAVFAQLLEQPQYRALLEAELERSFMEDEYEGEETEQRKQRLNQLIFDKAFEEPAPAVPVHRVHVLRRGWTRWAAAAVIILLLGGATAYIAFRPKQNATVSVTTPAQPADISPGHDGAILTLADGSSIVLDSARKGALAQQQGAELVLNGNRLDYNAKNTTAGAVSYNMLQVPRGRQFQLVLPDGTKVWLNAASSLRYPTAFTGNKREVEITGEAFFEVAQDASKPFIVKKGDLATTVLGTAFNINTYDEESSRNITLLQGSVQVSRGGKQVIIKPGQQAQVSDGIKVKNEVDLDEVTAWKDGKFMFGETADIRSIMNQVANWYDVDVEFKGTVHNHIGGTISRTVNLSLLLKMLETTGVVDFQVKGRTIEVIPK
ncbi:MAG: FecR domain-containing protein [Bacteroidetes bacterium]|nr:FecR domain-containing protein [Bacteroidota bacterium]